MLGFEVFRYNMILASDSADGGGEREDVLKIALEFLGWRR
jgi:hypothetical protein